MQENVVGVLLPPTSDFAESGAAGRIVIEVAAGKNGDIGTIQYPVA